MSDRRFKKGTFSRKIRFYFLIQLCLLFNCFGHMIVSDVSDFKFVGKVKPAFLLQRRK